MTAAMAELVQAYTGATGVYLDVVGGLSERDLDAVGADSGWTPRQVIHHMADAETRSAIRLRQLLGEDTPVIVGYDESEYARRLPYGRPVEASIALVRAVRAANAELLGCLDAAALRRAGTHTESGPYTVRTWLEIYTAHPQDHAAQITAALTSSGAGTTR